MTDSFAARITDELVRSIRPLPASAVTFSDWVADAIRDRNGALAECGGKLEFHSHHTTADGRALYVRCPLDGLNYKVSITQADPPASLDTEDDLIPVVRPEVREREEAMT